MNFAIPWSYLYILMLQFTRYVLVVSWFWHVAPVVSKNSKNQQNQHRTRMKSHCTVNQWWLSGCLTTPKLALHWGSLCQSQQSGEAWSGVVVPNSHVADTSHMTPSHTEMLSDLSSCLLASSFSCLSERDILSSQKKVKIFQSWRQKLAVILNFTLCHCRFPKL